uniref:Uncharacterized protein n=1 Tax=Fagus sylvatica TaxID=28930 RepID=A0A2N9GV45_FAGSY
MRKSWETYIELFCVTISNCLALINELIEEQESSKAVLTNEPRNTHERQRGDAAERELNDTVVWPGVLAVAGGASQHEMRDCGDDDGEEDEHGPRETDCPHVGLVHAHPSEIGSEAL